MPNITQRQAALGVLSLMLGVGVIMFFYYTLGPTVRPQLISIAFIGSLLVGLMLIAYWRGWESARPIAVLIVTLVEAFAIANPREAAVVSFGVFLPPVLALVLTRSRGVLASAVIVWSIVVIRAGGEGVYTHFSSWFIYLVCLSGLIVARLVTKTAQRAAEASAQAARTQAAELRRTAEVIRQAEQSYRHLFENTVEGLYRSSLNGQILRANPALVRLYGYTTEAEMLAAVNRLTTEWYVLPQRRAEFQLALETDGHITDFEAEIYRHKTRERIWISESAHLVRDRDGAALWYEGSVQNITERKRAEQALRQSEERYRFVTEGLAHFIFVVQDGLVEYMNSYWTRYTGLPASAGLQRGWVQVQHPEDHDRLMQEWRTAMRLGQRSESEHRIRRADGHYRWHRTILQPMPDEALAKTKWIGLTVDIHDQKEAEAHIRQLNETLEARVRERTAQLEAANRELESFTYSVSHDLRAPLRAMDGFSRLLLRDHALALSDEAQSHLNRIRAGAQRMGALIDDLLTFARLGRQAVTKQRVAMTRLVERVWEDLQLGADASAVTLLIQDMPDCYADRTLLKQVLANLLDNARKFTRQTPAARIEVGYQRLTTEEGAYFVRDNGAGFDMRYVNKLFGVFQRLHAMEDYEGTGVGLAIVHRIIQRHGGRVWAEGEEGRGATFYFTLDEKPNEHPASPM